MASKKLSSWDKSGTSAPDQTETPDQTLNMQQSEAASHSPATQDEPASAVGSGKYEELGMEELQQLLNHVYGRRYHESLDTKREIVSQLIENDAAYAHHFMTLAQLSKANDIQPKEPGVNTSSSFTLFRKLPVELRFEIWKLAIPGPRVLKLELFMRVLIPDQFRFGFLIHSPTSGLLKACKESRTIALKKLTARLPSFSKDREIRFDPKNDAIYVPNFRGPKYHLNERLEIGIVSFKRGCTYFESSLYTDTDKSIFKDMRTLVCEDDFNLLETLGNFNCFDCLQGIQTIIAFSDSFQGGGSDYELE